MCKIRFILDIALYNVTPNFPVPSKIPATAPIFFSVNLCEYIKYSSHCCTGHFTLWYLLLKALRQHFIVRESYSSGSMQKLGEVPTIRVINL